MLKNLVKSLSVTFLSISLVSVTTMNPSLVNAATVKSTTTATKTVTSYADTIKPVITLVGKPTINLSYGASYVDAGVKITDNKDTKLSSKVTYTYNNNLVTSINTKNPGTYIIHYNVKDSAGNKANEVIRTVIVAAKVIVVKSTSVNIKDFGAHSIDEVGYSNFDSSDAINKAIQYAKSNKYKSVNFDSGRYYAKYINLESNLTYLSTQSAELIADKNIELNNSILSAFNKENITIQNLNINGNYNVVGGNDQSGIALIGLFNCKNITIENCYLHENNYLGILLAACENVSVKNNKIYDTDCGVEAMGEATNYLTIDGNEIYGGKIQMSEPISIFNTTTNGLAHDITITNNKIHDKQNASGIFVRNARTVLIKGNTVYNCANGIATGFHDADETNYTIATNITITENTVYKCNTGLSLELSNSTISNNNISEMLFAGICILSQNQKFTCDNNLVTKNIITNVNYDLYDAPCIRLQNSKFSTVSYNTLNDTRQKPLNYASVQLCGAENTNNIIQNNIGNTINNSETSILVEDAINTQLLNNVAYIFDYGTGTKISNN